MKVFLGGTCNNSMWREQIKPILSRINIEFFDPVVPNWNEAAYQEELKQREECDFCLYVITPRMAGVYSIAEVVDDSNKRPEKTLLCIQETDDHFKFDEQQLKSLYAVGKMVKANGGEYFNDLNAVVRYINEALIVAEEAEEDEDTFSEHDK